MILSISETDEYAEYNVAPKPNLIQTAMCDLEIRGIRLNFHEDMDNMYYFGLTLRKYDGSGDADVSKKSL